MAELNRHAQEVIAQAESWDDRYLRATIHSLEHSYDERQTKDLIRKFLHEKNRGALSQVNPFAKRLWLPAVIEAFLEHHVLPSTRQERQQYGSDYKECGTAYAMVTFTHEGWVCSEDDLGFDLAGAKQKVRKALQGLDYIAAFETALYVNEFFKPDEKLVSFHCHTLVWADSFSQLKRRCAERRNSFVPILDNKSGMRLDRIKDPEEALDVLAYMDKLPFKAYRTIKVGPKRRQRSASMSRKSRVKLLKGLKDYSVFDFWLSGGEGRKCLRTARKNIKQYSVERSPMTGTSARVQSRLFDQR